MTTKAEVQKWEDMFVKQSTPYDKAIHETIKNIQDLKSTLYSLETSVKMVTRLMKTNMSRLDKLKALADKYKTK